MTQPPHRHATVSRFVTIRRRCAATNRIRVLDFPSPTTRISVPPQAEQRFWSSGTQTFSSFSSTFCSRSLPSSSSGAQSAASSETSRSAARRAAAGAAAQLHVQRQPVPVPRPRATPAAPHGMRRVHLGRPRRRRARGRERRARHASRSPGRAGAARRPARCDALKQKRLPRPRFESGSGARPARARTRPPPADSFKIRRLFERREAVAAKLHEHAILPPVVNW